MCVTPLSPPLVAQHPLQVGLTGFVLRTPHLGCQPVASSRRVWLPAPSLGASPGGGGLAAVRTQIREQWVKLEDGGTLASGLTSCGRKNPLQVLHVGAHGGPFLEV